ncbi:MAG: hypothetical protein ACI9HK_003897 [Pirellulaceae bacterium]|jgi:hypothetical protein
MGQKMLARKTTNWHESITDLRAAVRHFDVVINIARQLSALYSIRQQRHFALSISQIGRRQVPEFARINFLRYKCVVICKLACSSP